MLKLDPHQEATRELYNNMDCIWRKSDFWHYYTKTQIDKFIYKVLKSKADSKILNAGSGGTEYSLLGTFTHLDIAERRIEDKKNYIIASIENLPLPDCGFDYVICVGSVINYTSACLSIKELCRVLKPGGKLILEYERSNSAELLFTKQHNKDCVDKKYMYNDAEHNIILYSDKLINKLLDDSGMKIIKQRRFHILSSVGERLHHKNSAKMAINTDSIMQLLSYYLAHNRILYAQKSLK